MVRLKNKLILIGMFLIILSMFSQAADTILDIDEVKITIENPKTTFDNIEVKDGIVHIPTPEKQYYLFGLIEKKLFDNIKIEIPADKFNFKGIITPKVFSCPDENYNKINGRCNFGWIKENIPLILNNSYYIFNVNHLTAYTIGSTGDYDSLQQCLFYINGTSDSCSVATSDYQETFSDYTFLNSVNQYPTNSLRASYGFEEGSGNVAIDSSGNNHNGIINLFTGASWENQSDGFYIGATTPAGTGITNNGSDFWAVDSSGYRRINHYNRAGIYLDYIEIGYISDTPHDLVTNGTEINGIYYDNNWQKQEGKLMLSKDAQVVLPLYAGESTIISIGKLGNLEFKALEKK